MQEYQVYIDRTGSIIVEAESEEEAREKVIDMDIEELLECADFSGWDVGDADLLED